MATNIPPHNLNEVVDACLHLLDEPEADIDELMEIIPAPDFPTAGIIYGINGHARRLPHRPRPRGHARQAPLRGHRQGQRQAIIVDEMPYQVNKKTLQERIAELVQREEDRRHQPHPGRVRQVRHAPGDRAQARRSARGGAEQPVQADAAAGHLRHQHGGADRRPAQAVQPEADLRLPAHRREVVTRRTVFELRKARERGHMLEGLAVALANIDEIIELIKPAQRARRPIINWIPLEAGEKVQAVLPVREYAEGQYVFFATANGTVKKTPLTEFAYRLARGKIAINLDEGDALVGVAADRWRARRHAVRQQRQDRALRRGKVRSTGRTSTGVRGIRLAKGEEVVSLIVATAMATSSPPANAASASAPRSRNIRRRAAAPRA
jgi:DNA gyrase/topoisomerase IV subunit A